MTSQLSGRLTPAKPILAPRVHAGLIKFGGVDVDQANASARYVERIPIDHESIADDRRIRRAHPTLDSINAERADKHNGHDKTSSRLRTHAGRARSALLPSRPLETHRLAFRYVSVLCQLTMRVQAFNQKINQDSVNASLLANLHGTKSNSI
jgi:hypothetical protein